MFVYISPLIVFFRVWDKVMSGSSVVLSYIAAALILTHRRPILVMTTAEDVLTLFNQVSSLCVLTYLRSIYALSCWGSGGEFSLFSLCDDHIIKTLSMVGQICRLIYVVMIDQTFKNHTDDGCKKHAYWFS